LGLRHGATIGRQDCRSWDTGAHDDTREVAMRSKVVNSGITVNAIAGTHVVLLGLDLSDSARAGCLGFAIQREDNTEQERAWLRGMKTFQETDPGLGPGGTASSREHPFQTFQWADYSAKPNHDYTYTVIPLYGTPTNLTPGQAVPVRLTTESETGATHSVWFNRGAVSSQEYARRFLNQDPDQVAGGAAYTWLSRGLLEALLAFIGRAQDASFALFGAVYEFQWDAVLNALGAASARGADVSIVFDAIPGGPITANQAAIARTGINALCTGRTNGKIMHNKFLVLTQHGQPIAVWTGSTNFTENGIFGHSNLGHLVEDGAIAQAYLNYWQQLSNNATTPDLRQWLRTNNVAPPNPWNENTTAVFSPHSGLAVLDWYATIAQTGQLPLMMTFPFGMNSRFQQVYEQNDDVLRIALLEKEGNGAGLAQGRIDIRRIRQRRNVVMAVGNNISVNSFDRWLAARRQLTQDANIRYVHTKYMLVDPLGSQPVVITGSANFSGPSTNENDENMLIIRNDTRVADIYVGEFMRLYSHYAFREAVAIALAEGEDPQTWRPSQLIPDPSWQADYFAAGNSRFLRRRYFAGT
jgi:phosphatidylserine/phosphatidylglycerophosphate/cardiolipin synthase-like enzyme